MTTDQINPDQPDRSDHERPEASAGPDRPFGFWLKLVDRRISEEMEMLFAADGITRRDWRILNLLAGEALDERLADRLRARPHALHGLAERGWITGAPPVITEAGREARDRLEGQVTALRERVAGAVSAEDFATTLRSLEAIARELGWDESHPMPRGHRGGRRHGFGGWRGAKLHHGFGQAPASKAPTRRTRSASTASTRTPASALARASVRSRPGRTSMSTCTCTTTSEARATAVVTTGGSTPRPEWPRAAHARRTATPMYDRPSDRTRPKSSLRLNSP